MADSSESEMESSENSNLGHANNMTAPSPARTNTGPLLPAKSLLRQVAEHDRDWQNILKDVSGSAPIELLDASNTSMAQAASAAKKKQEQIIYEIQRQRIEAGFGPLSSYKLSKAQETDSNHGAKCEEGSANKPNSGPSPPHPDRVSFWGVVRWIAGCVVFGTAVPLVVKRIDPNILPYGAFNVACGAFLLVGPTVSLIWLEPRPRPSIMFLARQILVAALTVTATALGVLMTIALKPYRNEKDPSGAICHWKKRTFPCPTLRSELYPVVVVNLAFASLTMLLSLGLVQRTIRVNRKTDRQNRNSPSVESAG